MYRSAIDFYVLKRRHQKKALETFFFEPKIDNIQGIEKYTSQSPISFFFRYMETQEAD